MTRANQWKLGIVILALLVAAYYLYPTYQFYQLDAGERVTAAKGTATAKLRDRSIPLGLDLQGGLHIVLEVDREKLPADQVEGAVDRAIAILRNRIDEFGVAEPLIQKQGLDRIVVQLPGVADPARAKALIGQTALLEFKLVRVPEETQQIFTAADAYLLAHGYTGLDSTFRSRPLTELLRPGYAGSGFIPDADLARARELVTAANEGIPRESILAWGDEAQGEGGPGRLLYVLKRAPELTGGSVANAIAQIGLDPTNPSAWGVSLQLNAQAGSQFAQLTQANVGRQLAIVLDGEAQSAPRINERIPRGTAQITGSFTPEEAKDLAVVLQAGSLPAPVRIIEERTVGPSLGRDSIRDGAKACLVGTAAVIIFMVIYYQASGALAIAGLILNVYFLLAILAGLQATLTLPGIAGIALGIGMAVDNNVLILERIREELRLGKSVRAAIGAGYDRAFRTILDSHVTTLISSAFLFQFGTGPIRGFAVTLSVGLIVNVVTAVFFTRLVYDLITSRRALSKLSI